MRQLDSAAILLQLKFLDLIHISPMLFLSRISFCMQSPDGAQPCWPSQSLWSLIAEQVPGAELPKIRGALGTALVDMYIDLYAEVRTLQECCPCSFSVLLFGF